MQNPVPRVPMNELTSKRTTEQMKGRSRQRRTMEKREEGGRAKRSALAVTHPVRAPCGDNYIHCSLAFA